MKRNLYEVFGERNATLRRQRIAELWTEDCTFVDSAGEHSGLDALDAAVATVQEHTPEFVFTEVGKAQAHHGIGRIAWGYGPKDKASEVTGLDIAVIRGTRIQSIYTFLDEP